MTGSFFSFTPLFFLLSPFVSFLATAHVELIFPPGINSKFDPQTLEANIDYSMTSPLLADGSNFPCKGYNTPAAIATLNSVATLVAGTSLHTNMSGTATHDGGSCQFSVSYDQGVTFAVIASIEGGCPLAESYEVPIPSNLPSMSKALFAWTWFNKVGNREMYMNCAVVDIQGTGKTYEGPNLFRANTFADGTCINVEGTEMVFPQPSSNVQFFSNWNAQSPPTVLANCNQDYNELVTVGPGSSSFTSDGTTTKAARSSSSSAAIAKVATTSSSPAQATITLDITSSSSSPSTTTSSSPLSTSTSISSAETSNESGTFIRCDTSTTFSLCANSPDDCTPMGSVADGTICENGAIVMSPSYLATGTAREKVKRMKRLHNSRFRGRGPNRMGKW